MTWQKQQGFIIWFILKFDLENPQKKGEKKHLPRSQSNIFRYLVLSNSLTIWEDGANIWLLCSINDLNDESLNNIVTD